MARVVRWRRQTLCTLGDTKRILFTLPCHPFWLGLGFCSCVYLCNLLSAAAGEGWLTSPAAGAADNRSVSLDTMTPVELFWPMSSLNERK